MKLTKSSFKNGILTGFLVFGLILSISGSAAAKAQSRRASTGGNQKVSYLLNYDFEPLRLAIEDLIETFEEDYPNGRKYLRRLDEMKKARAAAMSLDRESDSAKAELGRLARELPKLQYDALLSNPLLDFDELILLKRKRGQLGLPVNHKCNTGIERTGYDNEIAALGPVHPTGKMRTVFRPEDGRYVGEIDLHYDAEKMLFTMPKGPTWQIFEIGADGTGLRQVSMDEHPDVDNFDACYLPDGRIVYVSTASYTAVPCWHGKERACNIYLMDGDGGNVRPAPGRAADRAGDFQPMGLHGADAHLSAAADGDEPRRHRSEGTLRKQFVLAQRTVLSTWDTQRTGQADSHHFRLSRRGTAPEASFSAFPDAASPSRRSSATIS